MVLHRLEERQAKGTISDGRPEILERQLPGFEPVTEFAPEDHLKVDASRATEDILEEIWRKL
jgi:thymidylate kinase